MTPDILPRPVARAVRVVAILLAVVAVLPLALGGLTTSFKAGMADPAWPTEPWFLIANGHKYELKRNLAFLMEHTHRAAAYIAGGLASVLAVMAWWTARGPRTRFAGLFAIIGLLATYGDFHRRMMTVMDFRTDHPGEPLVYPATQGGMAIGFALLLVGACVVHLFGRERGKWVRSLSGFILIAVMIQGLLGGFRVFLDQLTGLTNTVGVEFSALHGIFAQVVFSAMVCAALLAAWPKPEFDLPAAARARLGGVSLALVAATFLQLLWAVWVRHAPTPLAQRLHFLTAFVVFGLAVWLTGRAMATPERRKSLGFDVRHLIGLLALQILLGVEAWMSKFAAAGPDAALPPEMRPVTVWSGSIRTLHQLIGTAILASSVVIAVRVRRRTASAKVPTATDTAAAFDPRSRADSLAPVPAQA